MFVYIYIYIYIYREDVCRAIEGYDRTGACNWMCMGTSQGVHGGVKGYVTGSPERYVWVRITHPIHVQVFRKSALRPWSRSTMTASNNSRIPKLAKLGNAEPCGSPATGHVNSCDAKSIARPFATGLGTCLVSEGDVVGQAGNARTL